MNDLKLYDAALEPLADLNNLQDARVTREVNGQFVLTYSAYKQELKTEYILNGNITEADNQYFDIVYYEKTHEENNKISFAVEAWHVFYRLKQKKFDYYTYDGTPEQIMTDILSGTPFTAGQVDFSDVMTFAVNEAVTAAELIYLLAAKLGGEVEFTQKGFEINILDTIGQDNGFEIRLGKNIKGIAEAADARTGEEVKSYEVDILELKNSTEYIEHGLQELEIIELGDTVYVIDQEADIDIINRIVKVEYDPRYRKNTAVTIANRIELLTDKVTNIERTSVAKEAIYNGIKIGPDEGYVAERSDGKAKTIMNATEGISIYSDTGGGLERNFFVDLAGKIQAKEIEIDGSGTFAGTVTAATIVGSTIQGGSISIGDNFAVDIDGNMTAVNGTFSGDITGSNIYGSEFHGNGTDSAYAIIGVSGGNLGDFTLMRGGIGGNFFRIYDSVPAVALQGVDASGDFETFLAHYDGFSTMYGSWHYKSYEVATIDDINNAIDLHEAIYHS